MTHRRQRALSQELDEWIPRGPRGSLRNELRMRVWIWRLTGHCFARGIEGIREKRPGFDPGLPG
jgi:hypothetical protein